MCIFKVRTAYGLYINIQNIQYKNIISHAVQYYTNKICNTLSPKNIMHYITKLDLSVNIQLIIRLQII
jgi:hypothetical protein